MASPRVLAILVAHNGTRWLDEVCDGLESQTYEAMDVVAVDNASTDGSRELLLARLGEQRVLVADRDVGFAGAVGIALDSEAAHAAEADLLLLVHDDLVLEPDAVAHLVGEVEADERVGIVGPKLVLYEDPRTLQSVGMAIDVTGRADSGLEPDELDQGQHDRIRPVLYVSTAGMLVRSELFERLGRFDRRYGLFREDLDLCWRAWLIGSDVEVVPAAVGRHARAASTYDRDSASTVRGSRFLAERNTLATLLKCYGAARLLFVLLMFFVVGIAKILGFLVTRRVTDAIETVRAWGWNVANLRSTLRLRGHVQETRVRTDGELRPLFARIIPRLRAYLEAIAERVVGEESAPVDEPLGEVPPSHAERGPRGRRGVLFVALALGAVGLFVAAPLLGGGAIRGGDFAVWPASPFDFLRAYASVQPDVGGLGGAQPVSPAQFVLGVVGMLALGSGWVASRLLLIGAIPIAWMVALASLGQVVERRGTRVAGATLYALSPPAIAAVVTGRLGAIVALVTLPGIALAARRVADPTGRRDLAWRASAAAALLIAVLVAFEPSASLVVGAAAAVGLVAVAGVRAPLRERLDAGARILAVVVGAGVLLLPWSRTLAGSGSPVSGGFFGSDAAASPFVRWAGLVPELAGFPGAVVGAGFVAAAALGVFLAASRAPVLVASASGAGAAAVVGAWLLGRAGPAAPVWPGLLLLVAAGAYAVLFARGLEAAPDRLAVHSFGWRQLVALVLTGVAAFGVVGTGAHIVGDRFASLVVGQPALPAFIGAEDEVTRRYRVLVLSDDGGTVAWDLVGSAGPTMLAYGADAPAPLVDLAAAAVADLVAGATPTAAARLGHANVRYVYVPEGGRSERLEVALASQLRLEPQAVEYGLVFRIRDWLPSATYLPVRARQAATDLGPLPPQVEPLALDAVGPQHWAGVSDGPGVLALAEPPSGAWVAELDGEPLSAVDGTTLARFVVPHAGTLSLRHTGGPRRLAEVTLQGAAALVALSLALRAPGFARRSTLAREAGG